MKSLSKANGEILDILTRDLREIGDSKKWDNAKGVYMRLSVDRLAANIFSLAHYFEQNGDLVPDPDMTFLKGTDGHWYPLTFQDARRYDEAIVSIRGGLPEKYSPRLYASILSFATTWLRNIESQQGLRRMERAG